MKESVSAWPSSNPAPRPATSSDVEKRIRVAFVEDDDDYREAVSSELADHGFDVTSFCDGTALLASLADGADPEIIILDWSLPSVSGIDLLPRLRRNRIKRKRSVSRSKRARARRRRWRTRERAERLTMSPPPQSGIGVKPGINSLHGCRRICCKAATTRLLSNTAPLSRIISK